MKQLDLILSLPAAAGPYLQTGAPVLHRLMDHGAPLPVEASLAGLFCQLFGVARQQDWPLAPVTAVLDGLDATSGYWLRLDPVHLEVGMGGLMLHDARSLQLSLAEVQVFARSLSDQLHPRWSVQAASPDRWYLRLSEPPRLFTTPLDQANGQPLNLHLPVGEEASRFMADLNEAQMALFAHPLNDARERDGRLSANGLWPWGGGVLPEVRDAPEQIYGDSAEVRGLARLAGLAVTPAPNRLDVLTGQGRTLIQLPEAAPGMSLDGYLATLDRDWFAPLLARLRMGRIRQARLWVQGEQIQGVSLGAMRAWRTGLSAWFSAAPTPSPSARQ